MQTLLQNSVVTCCMSDDYRRPACATDDCRFQEEGTCTFPSRATLGKGRLCLNWAPRDRVELESRVVCRACGLPVARDAEGAWLHLGVNLNHDPVPERW